MGTVYATTTLVCYACERAFISIQDGKARKQVLCPDCFDRADRTSAYFGREQRRYEETGR